MGRPDPCVLFAQTFFHSQLDEYVDEVQFAEPVLITACEFLEQNATPCATTLSLVGATSPPSFALEVFVQCEGEPRFRRLCPAFLYSHSSSNLLEVEAVVTSHLVVRGSYRSLTLAVYGNTAEDLGQFNIEFDLDNSLVNLVASPSEEKLENLPPAFYSTHLTFGNSDSTLLSLSLPPPQPNLPKDIKQFLQLTLKICRNSILEEALCKLVNLVASALSSYINSGSHGITIEWKPSKIANLNIGRDQERIIEILAQTKTKLLELYRCHKLDFTTDEIELIDESVFGSEDLATSEDLIAYVNQWFEFTKGIPAFKHILASQKKKELLYMGIALLFCSSRESCFHFVSGGGMTQIIGMLCKERQRSRAILLMLLAVIEHATRHAVGCEGFLGWWPREDENVPIGNSEGYSQLLSLLLQKPLYDVASLTMYILHRLRLYEIVSRYECFVLSALGYTPGGGCNAADTSSSLLKARSMLKKVSKLIHFSGHMDESSELVSRGASVADQAEALSYKATVDSIASSKYSFTAPDIDTHLLFLFKERGFFPISAALLSSPALRSASDSTMDIFVDVTASIELIVLSLLRCRSGLTFLLLQPETMATLILSLKGTEDTSKAGCLTLRESTILISKGFFCPPVNIGMIVELHLRVVHAIDRLLVTSSHSEEQLWLLWDLCSISRSESGCQALLVMGCFPEAISVLLEALCSFKDMEQAGATSAGASPLSLVAFHCAAEIFEVLVTDPVASSLSSWIGHALVLHKALHSSSPGSSRKDAPIRLLEWIDAGVVYHKNGAAGLLSYAAILASGRDAHLTAATVLESDSMDVEKVIEGATNSSDSQVIDNLLGKLVADKYFDGVTLHNTSIVQLTTAFRLLAFVSEKSAAAAALYEEGALTLIYVVLVNCKFMLEQSSNSYDYLVDEGRECNSTSDLLLERNHEQSLVNLMIPLLVFLMNLLQKLKDAKEQYRNTKLLNALVALHREISPRVASRAVDSSLPYPTSALGLHAVCRLLVSALTCWPIFGWSPGLFHCILGNIQPTSLFMLGPKDACSLLCLLADLFPEEGIWLWMNGMPAFSALRSLSVGIMLGCQGESYINWYLQTDYQSLLLVRLKQQLDKIAQIILHFSFSALDVLHDMLRVFIVRLACQRPEFALEVLHPIVSWMHKHLFENNLSDVDVYKVYRILNFVAGLLEHPQTKTLLVKEGIYGILANALKRCHEVDIPDGIPISDIPFQKKVATSLLSWILPVCKSLCMIFSSQTLTSHADLLKKQNIENLSMDDTSLVSSHLLKFCQFLPVGKELLACLLALKEIASCVLGKSGLVSVCKKITSGSTEMLERAVKNDPDLAYGCDWGLSHSLINCWRKLLKYFEVAKDDLFFSLEAIQSLCSIALHLCLDDQSLEGLKLLKFLFGIPYGPIEAEAAVEEKLKDVHHMVSLFNQMIDGHDSLASDTKICLNQVKESIVQLLHQLQRTESLLANDDDAFPHRISVSIASNKSEKMQKHPSDPSITATLIDDAELRSLTNVWKAIEDAEQVEGIFLGGLSDKFVWDCPDSSSDRLGITSLPLKRKLSSLEGSSRRARDNTGPEAVPSNSFSRGLGAPSTSSGPSRRDTFRQRKPNTSRPPSMHVDDYVARERNVDGVNSSINVLGSSQRGSGRPPSIHVDEFMARQRERQSPMAGVVAEVAQVIKSAPLDNGNGPDKSDIPHLPKANLDDDLQEIDIVFDEESESDDELPFPQPDDNLQPSHSVIPDESSPGSIVEESEGDVNGDLQSDLRPVTLMSQFEGELGHDVKNSSEKNHHRSSIRRSFFREQSDESRYLSPGRGSMRQDDMPATNVNGFPSNLHSVAGTSSQQFGDFRPPNFYLWQSPQKANIPQSSGSHGYYEPRIVVNQPPLPPTPPPTAFTLPSTIDPVHYHQSHVQASRDAHPPLPTGHPLQVCDIKSDTALSVGSNYAASMTAQPILEPKHVWSGPSACAPPLPPTPPPFSTSAISLSSMANAGSQSSFSTSQLFLSSTSLSDPRLGQFSNSGDNSSLSISSLAPSLLIARPASGLGGLIGSSVQQQLGNFSNLSPQVPNSSSIPSIQAQAPPPPPPPQLPHPSHLTQPLIQTHQMSQTKLEQMLPLQQNAIQAQSLQVQQPIQIPQIHVYYQQQQDPFSRMPQPVAEQPHGLSENVSQQQEDSGFTLQQYFSSPEAIQSLLSDRDKLCQLLEQHPKLMQMLQERLGQM